MTRAGSGPPEPRPGRPRAAARCALAATARLRDNPRMASSGAMVDSGARRYATIGGVAAWRIPLLAAILAAGALALDAWDLVLAVVIAATAGQGLQRGMIVEVAPAALTRGLTLRGAFLAHASSLAWPAVVEVHTDWCRPRDDSALETTVRGADGTTIRFSTAMGLRAYWACLADVASRATRARRSGLTDAVLAEPAPARPQLLAALRTAGALALVLLAMIGLYHVLAQGRSGLSRYLDEVEAPGVASPRR